MVTVWFYKTVNAYITAPSIPPHAILTPKVKQYVARTPAIPASMMHAANPTYSGFFITNTPFPLLICKQDMYSNNDSTII